MSINTLDSNLPLIFLGDHHGAWSDLFYLIDKGKLRNCHLISVGDCGIGFESPERQAKTNKRLNHEFAEYNIFFKSIRGNHDDPSYFNSKRVNFSNFELIEDYSVYNYNDKTIQFIGGAVSIDRIGRKEGISYWEGEGVRFDRAACQKVDILVTHTAPSHCFPQKFNEMVYGWAKEDDRLLKDLTAERAVMDEIFEICRPSQHFYGHFHSSCTEKVNGCTSKLLNINELYELR